LLEEVEPFRKKMLFKVTEKIQMLIKCLGSLACLLKLFLPLDEPDLLIFFGPPSTIGLILPYLFLYSAAS
jgi:hypothetical protein